MSYDRALTIFSPDGHLFQVEYAQEAVRKGTCAVGICGKDAVVLGVEKKAALKLQDSRTMRKIHQLDEHIFIASAGLVADARVLVDMARVECQNHRLNIEDPPTVEFITHYIASIQQKYTQSGGRRPFGISTLIVGFDPDHTPKLFQTDPSGIYYQWKANSIGRNSKTVREFLEKHYTQEMGEEDAVKLAVKSLLEVVQTGAKNIEILVITKDGNRTPTVAEVEDIIKVIEAEKAEEAEKKAKPSTSSSS
ncbi:Proteasome subunit alpha type-4 [Coemansia sp. RSA 1813]|nr:Proteasome subunit alpha type-4 [Coemansia sp. RSA 1646]KAJ1773379.1 Proteasome subunit alpha type-4 [Coemansia sp. RSA 1843]KAJ2091597.1 Proteasome subunit alpha type-4 [Coemansia sp. RSA 986]KAJ2212384.1 Proteasome subunit alpha type-4 [Coemansia sp. RSA 487]KAJ2572202.1 Proteasome subunit alpha type-4 [Coemansia sp. RSA 1813]